MSKNETPKNYRDLRVWQFSLALAKQIYSLTSRFPAQERFGLVSQMRRSAVSIPSNIAEGHARLGAREFLHFISIAMGSVAELETHVYLCQELGFLSSGDIDGILKETEAISKMLRGLQKSLETYSVRDQEIGWLCSLAQYDEIIWSHDHAVSSVAARDENSNPEPRAPNPENEK